ncbi:hypothetical protein BOTBODRAFT_38117 [Botryobasidium botryosum FD-172 SS1]|uniref:Uncharacterized protein n=1 Tax=Botryobasidium botryosum (strain FD-172 SS1) TaxID=930990 RepID=A0A067M9M8_BOTB1|nr:hypothetical protein BOTBODRAFT_38117 [Botryobasidium botryosum FD-172 SS1]
MHLARQRVGAIDAVSILDARFDPDARIFTAATPSGFAVYRANPLKLLRKRDVTNGTLSMVLPLHSTSLLFLLGGGRSPRYPPNKVVLWDDALNTEVAELEFKERVRGMACRRGWLAVALKRRVVVFQVRGGLSNDDDGDGKGKQKQSNVLPPLERYEEWETCVNPRGILALATAPNSTLLAIPGRQTGHVQLIHLPPCPAPPPPPISPPQSQGSPLPPPPSPLPIPTPTTAAPTAPRGTVAVIRAHTTPLTSLSLPTSGRLIATTSARGTLIRVWDARSGSLVRELRRGTDQAEIWGVAFRGDEREVAVWSDKGTVHVFKLGANEEGQRVSNRHSSLSSLSPYLRIPKYFSSEWSYAMYRLPTQSAHIALSQSLHPEQHAEEERCVVTWIQVFRKSMPEQQQQQQAEDKRRNVDAGTNPNLDPGREQEGRWEWQLLALTYAGEWYRLSLPSASVSSSSTPAVGNAPLPPDSASVASGSGSGMSFSPPRKAPSVLSGFARARTASYPHPHPHSQSNVSRTGPGSMTPMATPESSRSIAGSSVATPRPIPIPRSAKGNREASLRGSSLGGGGSGSGSAGGGAGGGSGGGKERDDRECVLEEFRRFGRWDGWG